MDVSASTICTVLISLIITIISFKVLNWVWLRPKRLEKYLKRQGFNGSSYRFLFGDLKEDSVMLKEAMSKPINISDQISPRIFPFLFQTVNNYGKNCYTWFGPTPRLNIANPEDIKEIFSKHVEFQKPHSNPQLKLLATGLANYEGDKWSKHRKIINPAFHAQKLKHMLPAFNLSCTEMLRNWEGLVNDGQGKSEVDIWPHLQNMTADVISRTAFGSSYEEGRKIFQLQLEQALLVNKSIKKVYISGWRFVPTKLNKRMKAIEKEVKGLLKGLIEKREKAMRVGEAPNDDLLGILMESNLKEIKENENNKYKGMSIDDVIEECKLFYFAGQETTSVLLVWTMVLLSYYPEWQDRAREEVLNVFGDKNIDYDGLVHLKVVTMILYEVLRLYPPVAALNRIVHKKLQLGNLSLPAGVQLSLPTVFVHQDPELWGEDAKEFKPERFAEGVSKATKGRVSFFPFGWGPRICIGQNFAMIEAKLALASILQRFTFELSPSYTHAPFTVITLQPQHGAHIILRKR